MKKRNKIQRKQLASVPLLPIHRMKGTTDNGTRASVPEATAVAGGQACRSKPPRPVAGWTAREQRVRE
jgi:hypothetical protein